MKKIISLALVVMMICTLSLTTFAAPHSRTAVTDNKSMWKDIAHVSYDAYQPHAVAGQHKQYTVPEGDSTVTFWGWVACAKDVAGFSYSVNGTALVTKPEFKADTEPAVMNAGGGTKTNDNKSPSANGISRFKILVPLTDGTQLVEAYVDFTDGTHEVFWATEITKGTATQLPATIPYPAGITPPENLPETPDTPDENSALIRPVDGANYKVDMDEIADTGVNAGHGYPDQSTKLYGYGSWLNLGNYDLSAFSAVEITYATTNGYDADAGIDEPAFFCLMGSSAGIGNPQTGMTNEDKIIGGKGVLSDGEITNPTGINWDKNERETTIDLTGVDYKGPVFLHHFNSFGNEALVVGIKFIAADGADTPDTPDTPDTTPDTPATNPETGDMAVVVIAAVAALALAGVVVCKKVRA